MATHRETVEQVATAVLDNAAAGTVIRQWGPEGASGDAARFGWWWISSSSGRQVWLGKDVRAVVAMADQRFPGWRRKVEKGSVGRGKLLAVREWGK